MRTTLQTLNQPTAFLCHNGRSFKLYTHLYGLYIYIGNVNYRICLILSANISLLSRSGHHIKLLGPVFTIFIPDSSKMTINISIIKISIFYLFTLKLKEINLIFEKLFQSQVFNEGCTNYIPFIIIHVPLFILNLSLHYV